MVVDYETLHVEHCQSKGGYNIDLETREQQC